MTVFNSQRPVDPNVILNNSVNLLRSRKANRVALFEAMQADQKAEDTKKQLEEIDKLDDENRLKRNSLIDYSDRRKKVIKEQTLSTLENRLMQEGFEMTLNTAIFEMVFNALWIDDNVKSKPENIHSMFETFLEIKQQVSDIIPANKDSEFILEMKRIIKKTTDCAAKRITGDVKDIKDFINVNDLDDIKFGLTEEENDDITNNLSDLGTDEIVQLVKDKVLSVVQDEQKAGKAKSEMFKEMDEALKDEESSDTGEENTPVTKESYFALSNRGLRNRFNRSNYSTIFESIMMYNNKDITEKSVTEGIEATREAITTSVFMNSILHYTVLETLNTLKLFDMANPINADKLINMYRHN